MFHTAVASPLPRMWSPLISSGAWPAGLAPLPPMPPVRCIALHLALHVRIVPLGGHFEFSTPVIASRGLVVRAVGGGPSVEPRPQGGHSARNGKARETLYKRRHNTHNRRRVSLGDSGPTPPPTQPPSPHLDKRET